MAEPLESASSLEAKSEFRKQKTALYLTFLNAIHDLFQDGKPQIISLRSYTTQYKVRDWVTKFMQEFGYLKPTGSPKEWLWTGSTPTEEMALGLYDALVKADADSKRRTREAAAIPPNNQKFLKLNP